MDMNKTAIFILGMHRSGTSAIAGMINCLGATLPKTLMPPQPDNPKGFFESDVIMTACDKMLANAGSAWDDWRAINISSFESGWKAEAVSVLESEFDDAPLVCIKDPRQCRILPPWLDAAAASGYRPVIVFTYRHALEVAESLHKRNGMPIAKGLLLWLRHVLDAEYYSRGLPTAFVYLPDLLSDWRWCAAELSRTLGIEWPVSISAAEAAMENHLDRDLKHHNFELSELETHPLLSGWVREAFLAFEGLKSGSNEHLHRETLDRLRAELDTASVLFGPLSNALESVIQQQTTALADQKEEDKELIFHLKKHLQDSENVRFGLNDALNGRNYEVIEFQAKQKVLEEKEVELVARLGSQEKAYADLLEKFDSSLKNFEQAEAAFKDISRRHDDLLNASVRERAELNAQIEKMQDKLLLQGAEFSDQVAALRSEYRDLFDAEVFRNKRYKEENEANVRALSSENARLQDTCRDLNNEITNLKLSESELRSNLAIECERNAKYSMQISQLNGQYKEEQLKVELINRLLKMYRNYNWADYLGLAFKIKEKL